MDCSQHSPSRIVPHRGQVPENSSEPPRSEHWRVFHEHVSRSHLANDTGHLLPKPASRSADTGSAPGATDVLARESAGDNVDEPSPWSAVELSDISKDGKPGKTPVLLPCRQNLLAILIDLDGTDTLVAEEEVAK